MFREHVKHQEFYFYSVEDHVGRQLYTAAVTGVHSAHTGHLLCQEMGNTKLLTFA